MTTWLIRLNAPGDGPRLAVKDCIDVAGLPTTVGCPVIAERAGPAAADAPVVSTARRLGARIVGKTNLTELCWSAHGVNTWSGTPVNPLDARRVPGGSSSGSAVAVATGQADVGYGTDTGGSVRIPAACCGISRPEDHLGPDRSRWHVPARPLPWTRWARSAGTSPPSRNSACACSSPVFAVGRPTTAP